ncbi:MAG: ADP-ribosylglycohydrolase [Candidatus Saccharibacteria bacterium]|nr:ADP-ribosylglycohydrolase [Candidatus Saccharibacteria bacterium]
MEDTNKHTRDILYQQGAALIPAIAYGDAAGLPVETRSAAYISEKYGVINELIPTKENPFYGSVDHPGTWSDDTQLTLAVAKALIKAGDFSLEVLTETHLEAYDETAEIMRKGKLVKRGWGGSTTAAMEKLHDGIDPAETGTIDGAGNGVLMKMAPLAYWQAVRRPDMRVIFNQYDQLTNMTHNSAVARLTTRVHGDMLGYLLREEYDKKQFMNVLEGSLALHEFETRELGGIQPGFLRDQLKYLYGSVNKETILSETDGRGFYAPQTLAMAYGAFMAHDGNFTPAVYEAVNLGGDTDSLASIVASMSAFKTKEVLRMPIDHQNLERLDELKSVSRKLAEAALGN